VLPTFVIGLREGMEAALIVGIVAVFLGQQGRSDALRQVWIGVAIAVVMVTYMVLWMRTHSRDLKGDLESAAGSALASGSAKALVAMAFLAVLREGFETVVFLLATFHASDNASLSWLGAVVGILLAVVLGYAIYKGGVHINLARFFRVTGIVLVVIAAGLVMTAVHTANEAGWLTAGQTQALDLAWLVRPGTPLSSFVTGVLGIQPYPVVDRGHRLLGLPGPDARPRVLAAANPPDSAGHRTPNRRSNQRFPTTRPTTRRSDLPWCQPSPMTQITDPGGWIVEGRSDGPVTLLEGLLVRSGWWGHRDGVGRRHRVAGRTRGTGRCRRQADHGEHRPHSQGCAPSRRRSRPVRSSST